MGRETRLFKSQEKKSRSDVAAFLHQLADKVAAGKVTLRQGGDDLILAFPENLVLELQAEDEEKGTKGIQHSLEIEIKWFDNDRTTGGVELK